MERRVGRGFKKRHSLAGGASGFPAYTYNAAGVHDATLNRNKVHREDMNHVQAYNGSSDILNAVQDSREGFLLGLGLVGRLASATGGLPRAAGQRMEVETGLPLQGVGGGHSPAGAGLVGLAMCVGRPVPCNY